MELFFPTRVGRCQVARLRCGMEAKRVLARRGFSVDPHRPVGGMRWLDDDRLVDDVLGFFRSLRRLEHTDLWMRLTPQWARSGGLPVAPAVILRYYMADS